MIVMRVPNAEKMRFDLPFALPESYIDLKRFWGNTVEWSHYNRNYVSGQTSKILVVQIYYWNFSNWHGDN